MVMYWEFTDNEKMVEYLAPLLQASLILLIRNSEKTPLIENPELLGSLVHFSQQFPEIVASFIGEDN